MKKILPSRFFCIFLSVFFIGAVQADDYPIKPIKIIVPFAPGGSNDVVMRLLAPTLTEELGQSVIVENRPGGGATIGMDLVAKSKPDGYTLGVANTSFGANPFVMSKMPFDTLKDFLPVSLVGKVPLVVVVNPSFPVRSIKELIEYAKKNPETIKKLIEKIYKDKNAHTRKKK